ncbi:tetratricopeptide repeat protein, partial [Saccharothrix sp. NRRL B-16348]|uniref:tetratricopeptide repeat protein n=1 Tax=Saccharothrix sp. NRRL B-16348 TaxID=1415542 RepID=UPI000B175C6B
SRLARRSDPASYHPGGTDRIQVTTASGYRGKLSPDHPNTLTSRNNLAGAYETAGDLGRAIPLFEAGLAHSERILGPDHPITRTIRSNLKRAKST